VPYREELDAALARTAAAEDELATARSENAHDHERIAELEKELAEARRDAAAAEDRPPQQPDPPAALPAPPTPDRMGWWTPWMLVPLVCVTIGVSDEVVKYLGKRKDVASSSASPTQIDVMVELSRAKADARKLMPDAALLQMETSSFVGVVDSRGFADLTKGSVTFDFFSPSQRRYVHVLFRLGGGRDVMELTSMAGLRVHDPPRCSVVDVWAEAIRRGASPSALASIRLRNVTSDGPAWSFDIDPAGKPFTMTLPDECPGAP
jgi:hypothetical protein